MNSKPLTNLLMFSHVKTLNFCQHNRVINFMEINEQQNINGATILCPKARNTHIPCPIYSWKNVVFVS